MQRWGAALVRYYGTTIFMARALSPEVMHDGGLGSPSVIHAGVRS